MIILFIYNEWIGTKLFFSTEIRMVLCFLGEINHIVDPHTHAKTLYESVGAPKDSIYRSFYRRCWNYSLKPFKFGEIEAKYNLSHTKHHKISKILNIRQLLSVNKKEMRSRLICKTIRHASETISYSTKWDEKTS